MPIGRPVAARVWFLLLGKPNKFPRAVVSYQVSILLNLKDVGVALPFGGRFLGLPLNSYSVSIYRPLGLLYLNQSSQQNDNLRVFSLAKCDLMHGSTALGKIKRLKENLVSV